MYVKNCADARGTSAQVLLQLLVGRIRVLGDGLLHGGDATLVGGGSWASLARGVHVEISALESLKPAEDSRLAWSSVPKRFFLARRNTQTSNHVRKRTK